MQECVGTNIQDDTHQCPKDKLFNKVDWPTPTRQPTHTYLQNIIEHDETKQDNSTQEHPFVSDVFGLSLRHLDYDQSCRKSSVTWLDHVNEHPKKQVNQAHVPPQENDVANTTVAVLFIGTLYWLMMLTIPTSYFYICHSEREATSFPMLVRG